MFRIRFQLISCAPSWPHHSADYRIMFSEPGRDPGWTRPLGPVIKLGRGIHPHQRLRFTKINLCDIYSDKTRVIQKEPIQYKTVFKHLWILNPALKQFPVSIFSD